MFEEKSGLLSEKKKETVWLIIAVAVYLSVILGVTAVYRTADIGELSKRFLQNAVYAFLLAFSMLMMKCVKKPFSHFGLFFRKMSVQIAAGAAIGIGLNVFMLMLGSVPAVPENLVYVVLSQLLVGISEEAFWRGFVLHMIWDVWSSKDKAVFFSSLLFGLSHFPIGGSFAQVIAAFIIGMFLAALHTEFKDSVGVPALAVGHALLNIF